MVSHLSRVVPVSEALTLPPYCYWAYLLIKGKSRFPGWMAVFNPPVFYGILKVLTGLMPDGAFRLAFTNGLMSEAMALWFGSMLIWTCRQNGRHSCDGSRQ